MKYQGISRPHHPTLAPGAAPWGTTHQFSRMPAAIKAIPPSDVRPTNPL